MTDVLHAYLRQKSYNSQQRMCSDKVVVEADAQVGTTDMPYSTPMGGFSRMKQATHEVWSFTHHRTRCAELANALAG